MATLNNSVLRFRLVFLGGTEDYRVSMSASGRIRVVIVDDHPLFRQGLRQAVEADARFELAGEADHGQAALETIQKLQPHVAVLDVNLPGMNGLEIAAALHKKIQNPARHPDRAQG